jgi:hypothetical protein
LPFAVRRRLGVDSMEQGMSVSVDRRYRYNLVDLIDLAQRLRSVEGGVHPLRRRGFDAWAGRRHHGEHRIPVQLRPTRSGLVVVPC